MEIVVLTSVCLMQRIIKGKTQVIKRPLCATSNHLNTLLVDGKITFLFKKAIIPFSNY